MPKSKAKTETKIELKDLLDAGCHFGHQSHRWNPKMKPYLYGVRSGIHIFDLAKSKEGLKKAAAFARETAAKGGKIIFVGTKRQAQSIVKEEAIKAGMPYITERWLGGTITNWEQIKKSVEKLKDLKAKKKAGEFKKYTKKENILIDREINRLERFFGGLADLEDLPEAIFVVDVKKEQAAVKEASKKGVKVIGIVDSNGDPSLVDWLIPANDDAVGSIKLIAGIIGRAAKEGKEAWEKKLKS